ncbi:MAG: acyl-CoA dehydrogenase family protein [Actinomycetota bacterium]
MDFTLDAHSRSLAQLGTKLAQEFANEADARDRDRVFAHNAYDRMREEGLFGAVMSTDLGGGGANTTGWLSLMEALAQGDASVALGFNMHYVATRLVSDLPNIDQTTKRRIADLVIRDGELISAPLSEPSSSSLLPSTYLPSLIASRDGDGLRVTGNKMFASIWEASDYAFMFAKPDWTDNPTHVIGFLMPTDQPDAVEVTDNWDTLGMRSTRSNQVKITDAVVPGDLVLCEFDDFLANWIIAQAHVTWGGYTGVYLGLAGAMVNWLQDALGTRTAKGYGQPMGYHPTISSSVGHAGTQVDAARLMMYRAAWEADTTGPGIETCLAYLKAKNMLGSAISTVVTMGTTAGGLNSLMRSKPYERMLRDVITGPIMPPNALACAEMAGLLSMGLDPSQAPGLALAAGPDGASA